LEVLNQGKNKKGILLKKAQILMKSLGFLMLFILQKLGYL